MADAYWIHEWDERYECNSDGKSCKKGQKLRVSELLYVKCAVWGFVHGEGWQALTDAAGPEFTMTVFGVFIKLLEVAAKRPGGKRGWILTGRDEVVGPKAIARKLRVDPDQVAKSLDILVNTLGWITVEDCDYAVECDEPVSCGVKIGNSPLSEKKAIASERNRIRTELEINTECVAGNAGGGSSEDKDASKARVKDEEKENISGGLNFPGPEGSGSVVRGSVSSDSEIRGISGGSGSDSGVRSSDSVDRAGAGQIQGGTAAFSKNEPPGSDFDASVFQKEGNGLVFPDDDENFLFDVDVGRVDPASVILVGLHQNKVNHRMQVQDRAMMWFKKLLPHLSPLDYAGEAAHKQARADITTIEKLIDNAWADSGGEFVCQIIERMQKKKREVEKSKGRLRNLMALWVTELGKDFKLFARGP